MEIKGFKLKSYTTTISPEKSLMETEMFLRYFGATAVMKEFKEDGEIVIFAFKIGDKGFKIPLNVDGVKQVLLRTQRTVREGQAYRVACRVLREWVHAQLSLVASGQAEPEQIFLPYLYNGTQTVYDLYVSGELQLENKQ